MFLRSFLLLLLVFLVNLTSCISSKKIVKHGYNPDSSIIKIGMTTAEIKSAGLVPAFKSSDNLDWYYVKITLIETGIGAKQFYKVDIKKITFNQDAVEAIEDNSFTEKYSHGFIGKSDYKKFDSKSFMKNIMSDIGVRTF